MKSILLFFLTLALVVSGISQPTYPVGPATWDGPLPVQSDPTTGGYTETQVVGDVMRQNGVQYNHYIQTFTAFGGGWLTQFNEEQIQEIPPILYGRPGTNTDYFLYQGENHIGGTNGVLSFDIVYFDIGAGNKMIIENSNNGYLVSTATSYQGQPPGGISIANMLHFNNGITSTLRSSSIYGAIVFVNSASYTGGLTDAQHVDGFVSEINYGGSSQDPGHGGDFTFPIGNGTAVYQVQRTGDFNETDHTLTVGWIDGDPNITLDPTHNNTSAGYNFTDPESLPDGVAGVAKEGFWDWHYQDASITPDLNSYNGKAMTSDQTITVSIPD
jgi:hypothetical protein